MHTYEETLAILECSKSTLANYVNDGRLAKHKRGRKTYYDEIEVAKLKHEIDTKREKYRPDLPPKEPITIPDKPKRPIAKGDLPRLNDTGMQILSHVTAELREFGIIDRIDKMAIEDYAYNEQQYRHFSSLAMEENGVQFNADGVASVHPWHRIAMEHRKQANTLADRLGLNPLYRQKLNLREKEEIDPMEELLNED